MSGELVYRVNGTSAVTMKTSTLEAAGLKERQHLQEWVLANPEILGEDVLIVTSEFTSGSPRRAETRTASTCSGWDRTVGSWWRS